MLYREIKDKTGTRVTVYQRLSDNTFIPCDPLNRDYRLMQQEIAEKGEAIVEKADKEENKEIDSSI